jgi:hypothetical protein
MTIFNDKKPGMSFIRYFLAMGLSWVVIVVGLINLQ